VIIDHYPSTGNPYNSETISVPLIALAIGMVVGCAEILFMTKVFSGEVCTEDIF
jgi:hypothetical protein